MIQITSRHIKALESILACTTLLHPENKQLLADIKEYLEKEANVYKTLFEFPDKVYQYCTFNNKLQSLLSPKVSVGDVMNIAGDVTDNCLLVLNGEIFELDSASCDKYLYITSRESGEEFKFFIDNDDTIAESELQLLILRE